MSKITAMRTKLDQGQIGHFILCFSNIIFLCVDVCRYCFLKNIRNIPKITKSFCKQSFRTIMRDSLVLEVSYGAKTYGIQYMYNSLIST